VQFSDNKFIHKYKLYGGCSILKINTLVVYIHKIVTAKEVLKDLLKQRRVITISILLYVDQQKKQVLKKTKEFCINAWLLCNLFPNLRLTKLAFKLSVYHPGVFTELNKVVFTSQTHLLFVLNVLFGNMFRLVIESSSGPYIKIQILNF
jgi:hypothetical protein